MTNIVSIFWNLLRSIQYLMLTICVQALKLKSLRSSDRCLLLAAPVHGCMKAYLHVFSTLHSTSTGDGNTLQHCTVVKHAVKLGDTFFSFFFFTP